MPLLRFRRSALQRNEREDSLPSSLRDLTELEHLLPDRDPPRGSRLHEPAVRGLTRTTNATGVTPGWHSARRTVLPEWRS